MTGVSRRRQGTQTVGTGKNVPARPLCAERPSCAKAALSSTSSSLSRCGPLGLALALSPGAPHPLWVHRTHPCQAALGLGAERPWHPQHWVCWSRAPSAPVCSCGPGRAVAAKAVYVSRPEVGTAPGQSLSCPGHPGGWGRFQSLQGQAGFLPLTSLHAQREPLCAFRRHSPTGCLSPARGLGCTHCASGPVSGRASYVCTRFWEPVCLRFFGCTPVPQAARPLARMPGWAHLSRAAREVDCDRRPARITGPAPTCLGSGQGACREPRGTLAEWARRCWGGVALQGGLGTAWWGGLQTQQRTYHSHPGSWESLPVLPRLMSWLSGSCFPGTVLLLPGHSS